MMSTAKYWWQIAVHRIPHNSLKTDRETQSMYHLLGTLYMYLPSSILGCLVYDPGENIFFRDIKYLLFVKKISSFAPIPQKINLENIKSICYNPRKSSFHTMCHFLCQALKIQILSFFFFQSLPLEPYASPSTKPLKLTKHQHQKNSKNHEDTQKPPRAKISAAGVSLVSQISSIAKFLPQRSSSRLVMVGTRTASLHYVF